MPFPDFMEALPQIDLPFPDDVVTGRAVRSEAGLVVFFTFHAELDLPAHSHGAQWGTVVEGEMQLTIAGQTRTCRAGDSYEIPAGAEHGATIRAGTRIIDVFAEPDRYAFRN